MRLHLKYKLVTFGTLLSIFSLTPVVAAPLYASAATPPASTTSNAPNVQDQPGCSNGTGAPTPFRTDSNGGTDALNCLDNKYLNPIIAVLSVMVGLFVVIGIITGGIQYASSAGDPQKAAAAKGRITKALIALVTYLFLFALLQFLIPGGIVK